jgi:RHS repeat-associated protein
VKRILILMLAAGSLWSTCSYAQVPTGTPPFGSFGGGPDVINLANLNAHYTIPVFHKPGRGLNTNVDLSYDSSIWTPVTSGSTKAWQPASNWGLILQSPFAGYLTVSATNLSCAVGGAIKYTNFVFYDILGTLHPFAGTAYLLVYGCNTFSPESFTSTATDGSGLILNFSTVGEILSSKISAPDGRSTNPPFSPAGSASGTTTDRNGNTTSYSNGTFTDTLGQSVVTVSGAAPSPVTFSYTSPAGTTATYTISYKTYAVKTNFGCSGIAEFGPTSNSLVDRISLPDGSLYQLNYEATTGFAGDVTGRLSSITLPTGGTIAYTYTGGNGGIVCADGSAGGLTRTTPDGTWTYARTAGTGAAYTTKVTDPQSNDTVIQFQGIYETQRQVYQGSSTAGTLLRTTNTCYNGSASPCTGTVLSLPITRGTRIIQLPDATGKQCKHDSFYNSFGLITEVDDYDYGASGGGVGSLIKKTLTSYASLGNGIIDRPASVTVQDGGATKAQTTFAYDETAVTATGGTPQHVAISGSRGNATTVKGYKDATKYLTSKATYFDTGNVQSATDVNNAQTTYTYGACGNSFPTSVSEPVSLSVSGIWNCTGAVLTSFTDENGKQTTVAYSDPYFWRPASSTDPTSAVTNLTYNGQSSVESTLSFNTGNSAVDVLKTVDGLGRVHVQQTRQSPGSSNFDSVEQDFDSLGRPNRTTLPYSGTAGQLNSTGPATAKTYDALGRVLSVTDPGGGSTTYSYSQNDVMVTSGPAPTGENTKRRQLEYDGLGRLTSVCEITSASGSGPCGQTVSQTGYWTKYTYDVLGDLLTVTQNAQAASGYQQSRRYTYDFLSRQTSENNPENNTTNYSYDTDSTCTPASSGDLMKRIDAVGNTTCYAYDALHRIISATYPSGSYASPVTSNKYFVYDTATVNSVAMANGKTRQVEAYTATTQNGTKITDAGFSYSARGEVADVYQATSHSGGYYHLNQTYWANGASNQLSGNLVTLPTFTFGVDGEGRSNSASASSGQNPVTSTLYNVFGQPYQVNFGSLDSDSFGYDSNTGRMTQYQFNVNSQALVGTLTWNANATLQKLVISDPFNGTDNQTCNYGYEDLNRVASANCGSVWSQTFGYDAFGNLTKNGSMSFQPVYTNPATGQNTNRFISIPGTTVSYDSNGNVLGDGSHTYAWDADGDSVTIDGVGLMYDALDRMVEQNRSGVYTQIVYAPTGEKLALMNGQSLQKAFLSLPGGQAEGVYTSSGLSGYRHKDWLGSARVDSTSTRTVSSTTAYAPFGETYAQSGTADLSFTGQNQDTAAGLYDFLAREYSTQGRWPSPDPAGLAVVNPAYPQSWNRYAYVLNNPLELTDPLGLYCINGEGNTEEGVDTEQACTDAGGAWVSVDGQSTDSQSVTVTAQAEDDSVDLFLFPIGGHLTFFGGNLTFYRSGVDLQCPPGSQPLNQNVCGPPPDPKKMQKLKQLAKSYLCGKNPANNVLHYAEEGATKGAITGAIAGFPEGGPIGSLVVGTTGAGIGTFGGLISGSAASIVCSFAGAYGPPPYGGSAF